MENQKMDKIINLISRVYSDEVDGSYIEKVKQRINACRKK